MKKFFVFTVMMAVFVSMFVSCGSGNSMADLPSGNLLTSRESPDGTYCFNTYQCSDSGELYIRGEVVIVETNETRNVYWEKYNGTLDIEWTSDNVIVLNEVSLDVLNDTYDCREK